MTVQFMNTSLYRYRAGDSGHEKENAVATQPISMPNEAPAEIKALIDTVLDGEGPSAVQQRFR